MWDVDIALCIDLGVAYKGTSKPSIVLIICAHFCIYLCLLVSLKLYSKCFLNYMDFQTGICNLNANQLKF